MMKKTLAAAAVAAAVITASPAPAEAHPPKSWTYCPSEAPLPAHCLWYGPRPIKGEWKEGQSFLTRGHHTADGWQVYVVEISDKRARHVLRNWRHRRH